MIQNSKIKQELNILNKKENRFLNKDVIEGNFKSKIHEKIPEGLDITVTDIVKMAEAFEPISKKHS